MQNAGREARARAGGNAGRRRPGRRGDRTGSEGESQDGEHAARIEHDAELTRAGANVDGWWSHSAYLVRRYPLGAIGAVIVLVFLFAPSSPTSSPRTTRCRRRAEVRCRRPAASILMGADVMGRDVYSRIVHGARISLAVGVASTLLGG